MIVGRWKGRSSEDGVMHFKSDRKFEMLTPEGKNAMEGGTATYELVTEVEPWQMYMTITYQGKTERMPLGIFKIQAGKLVIRSVTEYRRSLYGMDIGHGRYDMPKDFHGVVSVYEKQR
jgi:hypothetical protein